MPMFEALDKQFSLTPDARVAFQPDPSSPLPGASVATLRKGAAPLTPAAELDPAAALPEGVATEDFSARLGAWLEAHIRKVLDPLFALEPLVAAGGGAGAVASGLMEGMGVVPRAALAEAISGLEADGRTALRQKKVRLGPAFVYLLEGNKPASVRLRALLWGLWNGREVPQPLPRDGAVSESAPEGEAEENYWIAIGYPRCGPRIVRVDMHDRLVQSVYDAAEKGAFRARHQMAEWLGCSVPDLYTVLEALGHRKIEEAPAPKATEEKKPASEATASPPPVEAATKLAEEGAGEELSAPESASPEGVQNADAKSDSSPIAEKPEPKKPELALFRLGGMRSGDRRGERSPRRAPFSAPEKAANRRGREEQKAGEGPRFSGEGRDKKRHEKNEDGERRERRSRPKRDDRGERHERPERVIVAEARQNPDDNPFAVLRGFKVQG